MRQLAGLIATVIIFVFFISALPSYGEMVNNEFPNKQKRFVHGLFKNKRYFDCIAETQRLLNYESRLPGRTEFLYLIEACYYLGGQYKTVISRLINFSEGEKAGPAYLFLLSHSYFNTGNTKLSTEILYKTNYPEIGSHDMSGLFVNRAELLIKNFEYQNLLSEIDDAGKYIDIFNKSFTLAGFRKDIEYYREIGFKSRWLSVTLSALLPGAGQIYSGRILDGIISFASVAGTAYGAYYFYNKKDKPLAVTLTFFSGLFYFGNIYGAYNSAYHTNKELNRQFAGRITQKYNLDYNPGDYISGGIFE